MADDTLDPIIIDAKADDANNFFTGLDSSSLNEIQSSERDFEQSYFYF